MSLPLLLAFVFGAAVTVTAQHATNAAAEAKLKQLQVAPGLKVELIAAEPLLQNPVAFSVDERGRFFIAETHRWKTAVFDITQRVPWLLDDLSCRTVADREALLRRHFPGTNFATLTNHSELVRLVEDTDGDGRADKSTVIADGFNAPTAGPAAGILARKGDVWFANIPELWRLTNWDLRVTSPAPSGAPLVNRKSQIGNQFGVHISVSGHDLHGLVFGPDGRLYFSLGDRGFELRPGMKHPGFSADYLRRIAPDTGAVFRCQPDGSELEVFCIGLRNPQGLAFDALGNLFTVDNDTAGPDQARLLHLVEGGDYGWRISYQHMKNFGPWVTEELWRGGAGDILPWSGEVAQGPAGLAFYPGTGLPDRYTNHFFICDFPGGIWSFSLKPRGASFELAAREKFLWNLLPTHAAFGPDGALYVSDWVEGWGQPEKGRLYRVSDPAQAGNAKLAETKRLLADGMEKRSEAELARLLAHDSMQVRLAAQFELAARTKSDRDPAVRELVQVALKSTNLFARLHAMWGLGQVAEKLDLAQLNDALMRLLPLLDDPTPTIRGYACQLFQRARFSTADARIDRLAHSEREGFVRAKAVRALAESTGMFRPNDPFNRFADEAPIDRLKGATQRALEAAGATKLADSSALAARGAHQVQFKLDSLLTDAGNATNAFLFHWGVLRLAGESFWNGNNRNRPIVGSVTNSANRQFWNPWGFWATNASPHVRLAAITALRRFNDPAIAQFLRDPDPRLVLEAARAINDAGIEPAYPALAALLPRSSRREEAPSNSERRTQNAEQKDNQSLLTSAATEWVLRRALNAHYRLGHATNAQALAEFAASNNASDALRAEAIFLLSAWEILPATPGNVPVKIARVDGHGSTPLVNPENWPGWFDRVCGLWRPLPPRDASAARDALRPHLAALLRATGTSTQIAAIAAVEQLALTEAAPHLALLVKATSQPAPARVASLRTLSELTRAASPSLPRSGGEGRGEEARPTAKPNSPLPSPLPARASQGEGAGSVGLPTLLSDSVTLALADNEPTVRREAVKLAAAASPTTAVPLLARVLVDEKDFRLRQAALTALGDLPGAAADAALATQLALLTEQKLSPELQLELLEAAAKRPALAAKTPAGKTDSTSDLLLAFRPALAGGDAAEGKRIFQEHAGAQCLRCHAVRGEGGIVGPALGGVGKRLTREQLLESIVLPNQTIAVGFENATLVLKSGVNHSGLVKSETATELVLDSPEDGKLTVKKADIEKRLRGLSAMPEGLDKLMTRRELRDLVEFLSGLK